MHTHSSWASRLLDSKSCHPCLPLLTSAVCLWQQNTLKVQDFSACWDSRHGLGATGSPDLQTLISWTCSAFEENISNLSASAGLSRLLWTVTALFNRGVSEETWLQSTKPCVWHVPSGDLLLVFNTCSGEWNQLKLISNFIYRVLMCQHSKQAQKRHPASSFLRQQVIPICRSVEITVCIAYCEYCFDWTTCMAPCWRIRAGKAAKASSNLPLTVSVVVVILLRNKMRIYAEAS